MTRYLSLLRLPEVPRLVLGVSIGRLPVPMAVVAILLLAREAEGTYAAAGAVAGANAIALGVMAVPLGRLVDRIGHWPTLPACACVNAAAAVGLVVAARAEAPVPVLMGSAALMGASVPPLPGCMRALWPRLTGGGPLLQTAFALEAALQEVLFILGPLLVALLVTLASPDLAILSAAVLALSGTVIFASSSVSRAQRGGRSRSGLAGALASRGIRTLVLAALAIGVGFGALQLAIAAFATGHGSPAATGVLFASWGVGALTASLWYGRRDWEVPAWRRYASVLCLLPVGLAVLAAPVSLAVMAVLVAVAGMPAGPMHATAFVLVDRVAPTHTAVEAFTVTRTMQTVGIAVGVASTGGLVDAAGASAAFLAAAGAAAFAVLVVILRRGTLGAQRLQPA